jgi:hypothetical protein
MSEERATLDVAPGAALAWPGRVRCAACSAERSLPAGAAALGPARSSCSEVLCAP